jgi:hypothetical protein
MSNDALDASRTAGVGSVELWRSGVRLGSHPLESAALSRRTREADIRGLRLATLQARLDRRRDRKAPIGILTYKLCSKLKAFGAGYRHCCRLDMQS